MELILWKEQKFTIFDSTLRKYRNWRISLESKIKEIDSEIENSKNRVVANNHIFYDFSNYSNKLIKICKQCAASVINKYSIEIERDNYESYSYR